MLSAATTSDPKDPSTRRDPAREAKDVPERSKRDRSAEFMHDLAESGTANELSTVKAASDAAESAEDKGREDKGREGKDGEGKDPGERRRQTDRDKAAREADG